MFKRIIMFFLLIKPKIYIFLYLILLLLISCYQEPINLDLSEYSSNIVIEGGITDQPGPYFVRISRTADYNGQNEFPPVSGATVRISDNQGNWEQLQEIESGLYQTSSLLGTPGRTYTLSVTAEGKKYTATSTMPQIFIPHTLEFNQLECGCYVLSCSFQDREGIGDFFAIRLYFDNYLMNSYLYQDNVTDGQQVDLNLFHRRDYEGVQVFVELITLNKSAYEFYNTLDKIDERDDESDDEFAGAFIPITTFNPTTNLDNGALGFFSTIIIRRYNRLRFNSLE